MRVALAAAALAALLAGCGPKTESSEAEAPPAAPTAPAVSDAEAKAMIASLPAPYNAADWDNGQTQFGRCRSCHTLGEGQANGVGPNLYGVFNRPMASNPTYNYSDALKKGGEHGWDGGHMDAWLENPRKSHPGTKMAFAGLADADDRRDVIAFLMTQTGYKPAGEHGEAHH